jgi:hypothetical protein
MYKTTNMNKSIFTKILVAIGLLVIAPATFAATFNISPTTVNTDVNSNFSLQIALNPQNVASYTSKLELTYPSDLLEVTSFTFDNKCMQLSQAGYDSIDNTNGILIKTAGYTGGITSTTNFGTVSFHAKKSGTANITVGTGSLILDSTGKNILSSSPSVSITIKEVTPVVQEQTNPIVEEPVNNTNEEQTEEIVAAETNTNTNNEVAETGQASLVSVIGNILSLNTNNPFISLIVLLIIVVIIAVAIDMFRKRFKKD